MLPPYSPDAPSRKDLDAVDGPAVVEFGTNWCGFCRGAAPLIEEAMRERPELPHYRVEDGKGRTLGRTFGVKVWPTLIVLQDGQEIARVVRPDSADDIRRALTPIG